MSAIWPCGGVRDLDPAEARALAASRVSVLSLDALAEDPARAAGKSLAGLAARAQHAYLHIDMDVFDLSPARASAMSGPGGLALETGLELIRQVKRTLPLKALGVASYDPACDVDDRVRNAALAAIEAALEG